MKKYYVTWGRHQILVLGVSAMNAAKAIVRRVMNKEVEAVGSGLRISERGFEPHPEDVELTLGEVVNHMLAENNN